MEPLRVTEIFPGFRTQLVALLVVQVNNVDWSGIIDVGFASNVMVGGEGAACKQVTNPENPHINQNTLEDRIFTEALIFFRSLFYPGKWQFTMPLS